MHQGNPGVLQVCYTHLQDGQRSALWRMQDAQVLDSSNTGGCAPELRTVMVVPQNSARRGEVQFYPNS